MVTGSSCPLKICERRKKAEDISLPIIDDGFHKSGRSEKDMNKLGQCIAWFWRDKRSLTEQARERAFIVSVNGLKTLQVTPEGGMSIDPQEIRERVIACRHSLKHYVRET